MRLPAPAPPMIWQPMTRPVMRSPIILTVIGADPGKYPALVWASIVTDTKSSPN